ncbi:hypothetical protein ACFQZC_02585 [Streptacidiphilus monticola]
MASKPGEESDGGLERTELLRMYLDVLRLRLSEDEFRVLGLLIKGVFDFMASGRSQGRPRSRTRTSRSPPMPSGAS